MGRRRGQRQRRKEEGGKARTETEELILYVQRCFECEGGGARDKLETQVEYSIRLTI